MRKEEKKQKRKIAVQESLILIAILLALTGNLCFLFIIL